jgi:hypothetical protein
VAGPGVSRTVTFPAGTVPADVRPLLRELRARARPVG